MSESTSNKDYLLETVGESETGTSYVCSKQLRLALGQIGLSKGEREGRVIPEPIIKILLSFSVSGLKWLTRPLSEMGLVISIDY